MQLQLNELELAYKALQVHARELRYEMQDYYEEDPEWQVINTELKFINNLITKIENLLNSDHENE